MPPQCPFPALTLLAAKSATSISLAASDIAVTRAKSADVQRCSVASHASVNGQPCSPYAMCNAAM